VLLGFDRETAVAEAQRGPDLSYAQATAACPWHVDIDGLVGALAAGDFDTAAEAVRSGHPWGSILGRCCHRFCQAAMASAYPPGVEPLNLRSLERAAADFGRHVPPKFDAPPSGKRAAVVGAGSGGLATALGLLRRGHQVTLVDGLPDIGGMLLAGYPNFRMPREVLRRELPLASPLLKLRLNEHVDHDRLDQLLAEYDAVCLAIGFFRPATARIPGDDLAGVYDGLTFLNSVALGERPPVGDAVAVLGAGFTAQDVARTVRRLGAQVHVLYRRGPEQLPVHAFQRDRFIALMQREEVPYTFFVEPLRVLGENGRVAALECRRTRLGPPDESGRPRPEPADEPPFQLPVSAVIKAFGQQPDYSLLPAGVRLDGRFVVNEDYRSTRPGLFVAGDIAGDVGNDGAFFGGLQAAEHMHGFMMGSYDWPAINHDKRMQARRPGKELEE